MGQDCSGYSRNVPLGFACRVRRNLHYILTCEEFVDVVLGTERG